MSIRSTRKFCVAALGATFLSTLVVGHVDDPKGRDRLPMYTGPGYRAGDDGLRGPSFPAANIQLQSWITIPEFPGGNDEANDCWGYVSPAGREYAIIGLSDGTGFVDITDPGQPTIRGFISGPYSIWRDIKTYGQYAYAVSEGGSGIQVISLANIDDVSPTLVNTVTTGGTTATHNVAIDTDSGFLYRCGGGSNGLRIYDLSNPVSPAYVGSWPDRYVHDAQVVTIDDGQGGSREIAICCSGFNGGSVETGIDILDVTNKGNIVSIARYFYSPNAEYSHQAWLSPDRRYLYLNDELDEGATVAESTMYVIDLQDLQNPVTVNAVGNGSPAITHNIYTRDQYVFAANYRSGIRVFDATDPANPFETAFFDTYPANDSQSFNSLWSVYPYFPSGTVIGSDIEKGLFVWRLTLNQLAVEFPQGTPELIDPAGQTINVEITNLEAELDPSTATLLFDAGDGQGFVPLPLVSRGTGDIFETTLPAVPCGRDVRYYASAETTDGVVVTNPVTAPSDWYDALAAYDIFTTFADDFNSDRGWVPINLGADTGDWQRGVPVDDPNWSYDPSSDSDGSGMCWLTQNEIGNTDVDDGAVQLLSPPIDLSAGNVVVSYDYYLRLTVANGDDRLLVEASSNGTNGPWIEVARHDNDGGLSWRNHQITSEHMVSLGLTMTSDMRFRFTANDSGTPSIVEAGLDAFTVDSIDCEPPDDLIGDIDDDGFVNVFDLTALLKAWGDCDQPCPPSCPADIADSNGAGSDCAVDVFDLILLLSNWSS